MDDENVYEKVFINNQRDKNDLQQQTKNSQSNQTTKSIVDHSFETLKESINNFRKKFTTNATRIEKVNLDSISNISTNSTTSTNTIIILSDCKFNDQDTASLSNQDFNLS